MNVSWAWQNQSQGIINWTFENTSDQQESAILLRSGYYFGDAFYEIYVNNGYSFLNSAPSALNGSPPLAVIAFPQPDGTSNHIVTFVFTLGPGQTWTQQEGGFTGTNSGGPTGIQCFDVSFQDVQYWCIAYDPSLPGQYDALTGTTDQPYEPNPSAFAVALFSAPATAPWMPFDPQNNAVSYLKFVTIMAPDNGQGWWWYFGVTPADVSNLLTQNNAMPVQLAPYWDTDGSFKFVVIMTPDTGQGWWWYWGQTPADVGNLLSQNNAAPTQLVPYWDSDGSFKLVVIMSPDTGQPWWWFWGLDFDSTFQEMDAAGNQILVQALPYLGC